ncbi:15623_t:CDS:2, partial [Gigaspora rosea]
LTKDFINAAEVAGESPFVTYFQNTQTGRSMATCIDYIFIEAEYSHLIKKMSLRHGNSDHMILECTLRTTKPHESDTLWRFDERCMRNDKLAKEIIEELTDKEVPKDWDLCKLKIQSIIRACKKPKATEGKIAQLNKKLLRLKKCAARQDASSFIAQKIEETQTALRDELGQLSEMKSLISKAGWGKALRKEQKGLTA